jgi:hypothetical protein
VDEDVGEVGRREPLGLDGGGRDALDEQSLAGRRDEPLRCVDVDDGHDDATERAFLVYAAIEGALVFAKAHRSTEPLRRLRRHLGLLVGADDG